MDLHVPNISNNRQNSCLGLGQHLKFFLNYQYLGLEKSGQHEPHLHHWLSPPLSLVSQYEVQWRPSCNAWCTHSLSYVFLCLVMLAWYTNTPDMDGVLGDGMKGCGNMPVAIYNMPVIICNLPVAPPLGFPSGLGNISSYTPPLVTIQLQYTPGNMRYACGSGRVGSGPCEGQGDRGERWKLQACHPQWHHHLSVWSTLEMILWYVHHPWPNHRTIWPRNPCPSGYWWFPGFLEARPP